MKKVCTVTHHTVPNYGAVLQAYALCQALLSLGADAEVLHYDEERVREQYHYSLFAQKTLKEAVKHMVYFGRYKKKIRVFRDFRKKYLKESKRYTRKNIHLAKNIYDMFITGSDQVWSLGLHRGDATYLLDFVKNREKKGSYAASFGYGKKEDIPEKYYETYRNLLSDFAYVNIRESGGLSLYEDLTGISDKAVQVVDPTFLVEKDAWEKIAKAPKEEGYILLYCVNRYQELLEKAKELSRKTGKKIINIQDGGNKIPDVINLESVTVPEFLGLIKGADFVFTNSFHGMAFSVIFEREMVFDYVHSKGNSNSRVESLTTLLGIGDRELSCVDADTKMDYVKIKERLQKEVDFSYEQLREMIK